MPEILRMVIIDTVINTLFGRLTLDPAGMHCPSWDDAFVSSLLCTVLIIKPEFLRQSLENCCKQRVFKKD